MDVRAVLGAAIGRDRLPARADLGPAATQDLCRYDLGTPLAWVRPRSTDEVARVVEIAREKGIPLVAAGRRTAYWNPLRFENSIVLETRDLDFIRDGDSPDSAMWCGAGAQARAVDERLRRSGLTLPVHPDAYGETAVGAMVATGLTSGMGMGMGSIDDFVSGLRVVLGTGEVLDTGAGLALSGEPFVRPGLPDPTGLFMAAEGTLGIVTELAIRPRPSMPMARLSFRVPGTPRSIARLGTLARELSAPGSYDTFRAASREGPGQRETPPFEVDLFVTAPFGAEELDLRVRVLAKTIRDAFGDVPLKVQQDVPGRAEPRFSRWRGEPGEPWAQFGRDHFVGVDVNAPYHGLDQCMDIAREATSLARALPFLSLRTAAYFAPGFVNIGLHWAFETEPGTVSDAHRLVRHVIRRFSETQVVPYRWGRLWGPALQGRLHPGYRAFLADIKARVDPDNILNSGASIFADHPARDGADVPGTAPLVALCLTCRRRAMCRAEKSRLFEDVSRCHQEQRRVDLDGLRGLLAFLRKRAGLAEERLARHEDAMLECLGALQERYANTFEPSASWSDGRWSAYRYSFSFADGDPKAREHEVETILSWCDMLDPAITPHFRTLLGRAHAPGIVQLLFGLEAEAGKPWRFKLYFRFDPRGAHADKRKWLARLLGESAAGDFPEPAAGLHLAGFDVFRSGVRRMKLYFLEKRRENDEPIDTLRDGQWLKDHRKRANLPAWLDLVRIYTVANPGDPAPSRPAEVDLHAPRNNLRFSDVIEAQRAGILPGDPELPEALVSGFPVVLNRLSLRREGGKVNLYYIQCPEQ